MSLALAFMFLALLSGIVAFGGMATVVATQYAFALFVFFVVGMIVTGVARALRRRQSY